MRLVASNIGIRGRQSRVDLFLRAIEVARLRNAKSAATTTAAAPTLATHPRGHRPYIRSFVEALVSSAILSIESRAHQRAWQGIAMTRGVQRDSLVSLLSKPFVQAAEPKEPLTVDIDWLMERMLEIMTTADTVESLSEEVPQVLINFNKRRSVSIFCQLYLRSHIQCNLITTAPTQACSRRIYQKDNMERSATELLNEIEQEVSTVQFDIRAIKEERGSA